MAKTGVTVVLGGQWGDEGKGKLTDIFGQGADIVARCQVSINSYIASWIYCIIDFAGWIECRSYCQCWTSPI